MSIDFTKLDSYKQLKYLQSNNRLNKEIVSEFIKEAKAKNILGEKILLKVAYINKLRDRTRYFVKVLDSNGNELQNPILYGKAWETMFRSSSQYKVGDILSAGYQINPSERYLYQLITPIEDKIKVIKRNENDILNLINDSIKEYIKEDESIFPLVFDKFTELYEKEIEKYKFLINENITKQIYEKEKTKQIIDELQERISQKNKILYDIDKDLNNKKSELSIKEAKLKEIEDKSENLDKLIKDTDKKLVSTTEKLKREGEKLQSLLIDAKRIANEKEEEIKTKNAILLDIDKNLDIKSRKKRVEEAKINELIKKFEDLQVCLGFNTYNEDIESKGTKYMIKEDDDVANLIQHALYHYEDENLVYTYNIVNSFYKSLKADQLVLLYGPSGTGKSSLINQFGKVIDNCKVHHIAVQSSWTDTQDLLGFFNPIQKRYVSTPFLEALLEARLQPNKLHIITLDEMNLAHIEYYFASILSIREKNRDERFLDLYSTRFYDEAKYELECILGKKIEYLSTMKEEDINHLYKNVQEKIKKYSREERSLLRNFFELTFYYPAKFIIPKNVRFVGTLNMDETVKPISPKVIDRSFIIELDSPLNHQELIEELMKNKVQDALVINIDEFVNFKNYKKKESKDVESMLDKIIKITKPLDNIPNATLNNRGMLHISNYLKLESIYNDEIINQLIYYKVLPRIKFNKSQEDCLNSFEKFIENIPPGISKEKASKMISNNRVVQFWES